MSHDAAAAAATAGTAASPDTADRSLARELVGNTYADIKDSVSQLFLVKVWWADIARRVGYRYHQATLVNGVLLLPLTLVAYCLTLELNPPSEDSLAPRYRHYIVSSVAIALVAQCFFSLTGICMENAGMLLAANVCAGAILLRLGVHPLLDEDNDKGRFISRIVFQTVVALLVVAHFVTSFLAFRANDGFRRFVFFAVGGTNRVQERYKVVQSWVACSRIDLLFTLLTAVAIGFFCTALPWHYVFLVGVVVVNAVWRSLILHTIKSETCIFECLQRMPEPDATEADGAAAGSGGADANDGASLATHHQHPNGQPNAGASVNVGSDLAEDAQQQQQQQQQQRPVWFPDSALSEAGSPLSPKPSTYPVPSWPTLLFVVTPLNFLSPVLLGLALYDTKFLKAKIPDHAEFLVYLAYALFLAARVMLSIATYFAWRQMGRGMQAVFENERGVEEYLLGGAAGASLLRSGAGAAGGGAEGGGAAAGAGGYGTANQSAGSDLGDAFAAAAKRARK